MTRKTNLSESVHYVSNVLLNLSLLSAGCYSFFRWLEPRSSNTTLAARCALYFFAAKVGTGYLADALNMLENDDDAPDPGVSSPADGFMSPGG